MKIQIEVADLRSVLNALEELNSEKSYWWQEVERDTVKALENAESICKQALTEQPAQQQEPVALKPFEIETSIEEGGEIHQTVTDLAGNVMLHVLDTQENGVRSALIEMGWTPPQPAQDQGQSCYCPECERLSKELDAIKAQQPVAWRDHVEQRLLTWKQSFVNKSGDQLALDDFMDKQSLDDLIDFVCDEYTSPPASKPLTDEQILNLVPGLQDCLCDPWDYNNSGDYYASIPKDMIRLARAIEAAHGIKEKNA